MEKKITLFVAAFMIACVSNSAAFALSPMGPPKALLGQDRWDIGIEYGYQTMDLESVAKVQETDIISGQDDFTVVRKNKHNIDDFKSNLIMARAGYGINDNWDAFVRLGVADAQGDIEHIYPDGATPDQYKGFDGGFGLAWGFGTRATFWQDDEVSWGGLFQITWLKPGDSSISLSDDPQFSGDAEIEIREVQVAIGPTWRVNDTFRLYGGPFLHFVNGDLDISGRTVDMNAEILMETSGDIDEESQLGGYAGAHLYMNENTSCFIELQLTGDAWGIGLGAARRF
ncbi:outer membrane protein [Planctomycetota bacterium]